MATTGLYSQHLNNRKVLHLRNAIIAIVLIILAAATLFPHLLHDSLVLRPQRVHGGQYAHDPAFPVYAGIL